MKGAYYNEIDPFAAAWLRELIKAGHIASGDVDERSIVDVQPADLTGYTQHHFFAGIGVWSYALRQAGWSDDRPVWTGSCPCQPFSTAGKRTGVADERHLWPAFHYLIERCKPPVIFGEQVEAAIRQGWLDLVQADLEGIGYDFGAVGLPAAGFGAPHIRQRLYFVGHTASALQCREQPRANRMARGEAVQPEDRKANADDITRPVPLSVAHWDEYRGSKPGRLTAEAGITNSPTAGFWQNADWVYCRDEKYRPVEPGSFPLAHGVAARVGRLRGYGNAIVAPVAEAFITAYMDTEITA